MVVLVLGDNRSSTHNVPCLNEKFLSSLTEKEFLAFLVKLNYVKTTYKCHIDFSKSTVDGKYVKLVVDYREIVLGKSITALWIKQWNTVNKPNEEINYNTKVFFNAINNSNKPLKHVVFCNLLEMHVCNLLDMKLDEFKREYNKWTCEIA